MISFHSPHLLWLLVPLLLLFSWELARHTTRTVTDWPKIARAWAGSFHVSLGTQHTTAETRPRIWLWFGLALCIIALARPQWGVIEEQVFDQSREVIIAVDLSKSMLAQDVKPSRLERSKLLITSLLDGLKGERVGLVLFAGTAFLQSPLSADYEVLREFLPALKPDYLPEGGSNYKQMLETAIQAFGTSAADRYLIVLSDGENTEAEWKSLNESLKNKGIRVIGLGVGTAQGSFIPDASGGFIKDDRGAVVLSRLNSSTLQELAQTTGGAYADASSWIDLSGLLKQTVEAGQKGEFSEKNAARKIERYQWFLAPGLLLLFISFWAEFPVRPRERALPLGSAKRQKTENREQKTAAAATVASVLCILSSVLCSPSSARAAETEESPAETIAKPLTTTVARLSVKDELTPKDCAEMAQTTITYGQRVKTSQQLPPEGVIRDGLAAVDIGEKQDAKAADWPRLRRELEELLKKPEDQQKKDQQKQDKDNQQQQNQQDQNKDQQQNQKDQQNQQQQQKSQQSDQQKQEQQQQDQNQSAFGDMKDQQEKKGEQQKQPTPQPPSGTQKVGGQNAKKQEVQADPELTVPLQKLDQVRNQDSPAKLQQIMQGQQKQPAKKGKDW